MSVFWFWREIGFGVTYVLRVQYSCGVVLVFLFWWEIVFGFAYVLSVKYSCAVVSVFGSGGKSVLVVHNTLYLEYHTVVFCCGGKVLLRPEKKVLVFCLAGCVVVSEFWFWREIGFGCTYYYVLGVPYSLFLLWRESFITTEKKSSSCLSGGLCCE